MSSGSDYKLPCGCEADVSMWGRCPRHNPPYIPNSWNPDSRRRHRRPISFDLHASQPAVKAAAADIFASHKVTAAKVPPPPPLSLAVGARARAAAVVAKEQARLKKTLASNKRSRHHDR